MMLNNPTSPDSTNNNELNEDLNHPDPTALTNGLGLNFSQFNNVITSSSELSFSQLNNIITSSSEINTGINTPTQNDFTDLDLFSRSMRKDILGSAILPITSPGESPLTSPPMLSPDVRDQDFTDANTQMSVVERAADLQLEDHTLWNYVNSDDDGGGDLDTSRKALKAHRSSDAATSSNKDEDVDKEKIFDAGLAASHIASNPFKFNKFGSDVPGVFAFGANSVSSTTTNNVINSPESVTSGINAPITVASLTQNMVDEASQNVIPSSQVITIEPKGMHRLKEPGLNMSFPSKGSGYEAKIRVQPEDQHRARYQTEGSRGAVKDRTGNGCPVFQLCGYNLPVNVQIFIGTDTGKVKPHGFYQACKVFGKNATQCNETEIEGTTVIEVLLDPKEDMTASIDCVGILKLRNADVEQRIGLARSKKKSTRARMVFRVNIPKSDGTYLTLQIPSNPILCTQPAGVPEVCKMSLHKSLPDGGQELFMIGKNFLKGSKVVFQEKADEKVVWTQEAEIDQEYFHASHIIATVPPYKTIQLGGPVEVEIVVECNGRSSEVTPFIYSPNLELQPAPVLIVNNEPPEMKLEENAEPKQEVTPMETEPILKNKGVSPEALALNKQYEEESRRNSNGGVPSLLVEMANNIPSTPAVPTPDIEMQNVHREKMAEKSPPTNNVQESLQELQQLMDEHGPESQNNNEANCQEQVDVHGEFTTQHEQQHVPKLEQPNFIPENFASGATLFNEGQFSKEGIFAETNQHSHEQVTSTFCDQSPQVQSNIPSFQQTPNIDPFTSQKQCNPSQEFVQPLTNELNSAVNLEPNSPIIQSQNNLPQTLFNLPTETTLQQSQNELYSNQNQQLDSPPQENNYNFPRDQTAKADKSEIIMEQVPQPAVTAQQGFGHSSGYISHMCDDLSQVKQQSPFNTPLPSYSNHTQHPLGNNNTQQMPPNMSIENIPQEAKVETRTNSIDHEEPSQRLVHNTSSMDTSSNHQNTEQHLKEPACFIPQNNVAGFIGNNANMGGSSEHQLLLQQLLDSVSNSPVFPISQQQHSNLSTDNQQLQREIPISQMSHIPVNNQVVVSNGSDIQQSNCSIKTEETNVAQNSLQDMHKTMQELVSLLKSQVKSEPEVKQESNEVQTQREVLMKSLQDKATFSLPMLAQQVRMTPGVVQSNVANPLQQYNSHTTNLQIVSSNPTLLKQATGQMSQATGISRSLSMTDSTQSQPIKLITQPQNDTHFTTPMPSTNSQQPQQIKLLPYTTIASLPQNLQGGNGKVQMINDGIIRLLLDQAQSGPADISALISKQLAQQQQNQPLQQSQTKPQLLTTSAIPTQPVKILRLNSQGQLISDPTIVANSQAQIIANQTGQILANQGQILTHPPGTIANTTTTHVQMATNQHGQILTNQPGPIVTNTQGQLVNSCTSASPVILPVVRQTHPLKIIQTGKLVRLTNGAAPLIFKGQNVQQPVTVVTEHETMRSSVREPGIATTRPNGLLAQLLTGPLSSCHDQHSQEAMETGSNWQPPSLLNQDDCFGNRQVNKSCMPGVTVFGQSQEKPQQQ